MKRGNSSTILALGVLIALGAAGCGPARTSKVHLTFGKFSAPSDQVGVRLATCPVYSMWVAVRGPGMPRIRIPIVGATISGAGAGTGNLSGTATITIPDQDIEVPAGPDRNISIVGRISLDDNCVQSAMSYPLYGETSPTRVEIVPAATAVTISMTQVFVAQTGLKIDDATLSVGVTGRNAGLQAVNFDLSALNVPVTCAGAVFRVIDTTVDGPAFRLTAEGGSSATAIATGSWSNLFISPLLPARRYRIEIVTVPCGGALPVARIYTLHYITPPSYFDLGAAVSVDNHTATCAVSSATTPLDAICTRP